MKFLKSLSMACGIFIIQVCHAQKFNLFTDEVKTLYPSAVYDFLERYLYEIDSLQGIGQYVEQRLRDDKVFFLKGSVPNVRKLVPEMPFEVKKSYNKFYEVTWFSKKGNAFLSIAFPMQYELLLGMSKIEIEKCFKDELLKHNNYQVFVCDEKNVRKQEDGCWMTNPISNYHVEVLNTATFYSITELGDTIPTFSKDDMWHSAANLFQGQISDIDGYSLYIEQNLYGFKKDQYIISLRKWLAYCQDMKLKVYFAIEEEHIDGLKGLLIAQSEDLGFNHMLSVIIPDDFVENKKAVIKGNLNAYIPTQNVKNLYQQYVKKPRKKI